MINRFDTSIDKGYVSNHIPLPFQELQAMAITQQKKNDELNSDIYTLKDLVNTVPVINDPSLGLSNAAIRKTIDDRYSPEIAQLSNAFAKGNDPMAQKKLNDLKRRIANDSDIIEAKESYGNYKAYRDDATKKAGKYDALLDDYRGQSLIDSEGNLKPFRFHGMEDKLDIEKRFAESMDKIKEDTKGWDIESLGANGIKIGKKGQASGITSDKVLGLARQKVGDMFNLTAEGQQFVKKLRKSNPNITNEEVMQAGVNALFNSGSNQIFDNKTSGNSVDVTSMWGTLRKEGQDEQKELDGIRSSSVEGNTFNAIQGDKNFGSLFDNGIFEERNGVIKFNPSNVSGEKTSFKANDYKSGKEKTFSNSKDALDAYHRGEIDSPRPFKERVNSKEVSDKFNNQIKKMIIATGIFKNEDIFKIDSKGNKVINNDKISELATAYNSLTKSRSLDLSLSPAVQESETKNTNMNWDYVKQVDPDNPSKTIENRPLGEDEKIVVTSRRTDNDGKMYNEGYIQNTKTNIKEPIAYRSTSIEKNRVFDALGKLQKTSIDNLSNLNTDYVKFDGKDATINMNTNYGNSILKMDGQENIGQGYYIQSFVDPKNKQNTIYRMVNDNNEIISEKSSLIELKKDVEGFYYTKTPEGRTELENIKQNKDKAENQQNAG